MTGRRASADAGEPVFVQRIERVAVISLNRPQKHNAISDDLYDALYEAALTATEDSDVRAIVLRGEGASFSSGRDTTEMGRNVESSGDFVRRSQSLNRLLRACSTPVVVALKGHVIGKALELALAADFRFVARGARLAFPEIEFGLVTDNAGATSASVLAGPSRAKYLLMSGAAISAEEAVAWNLADWLVEPVALDDAALGLATRLAARSPAAIALTKQLVNQTNDAIVALGFQSEMLAQRVLFAGDDHREAVAARREARTPDFRAR